MPCAHRMISVWLEFLITSESIASMQASLITRKHMPGWVTGFLVCSTLGYIYVTLSLKLSPLFI